MVRRCLPWLCAPVAMAAAVLVATRGGPFIQVAVLALLVGAAMRWPAPVGRLHPVTRAIVLLCLVVALQAVWFRYGWTVYRPICLDGTNWGSAEVELIGPLSPEAVAWLTRDDRGSANWRRYGDDGVLVRPAKRMIFREILWNQTSQAANGIAWAYGLTPIDHGASDSCDDIERIMMEDGRAIYRSQGWGYWPYTTVNEFGPLGEWIARRQRSLTGSL
jgi:hypothetical protein